MQHQQHNWSAQLDAYQNNTLSDAQRFELEKAALDDPFLFDALEGYALYSAGAASDSEAVPTAAKSTSVFSLRNMAVAASLLVLVAVVGYMQTQTTDSERIASADVQTESIPSTDEATALESTPIAMASEPATLQEAVRAEEQSAAVEEVESAPVKNVKKTPVQDGVKVDVKETVKNRVDAGTPAAASKQQVSATREKADTKLTANIDREADAVVIKKEADVAKTNQSTALSENNSRLKKSMLKGQKEQLTLAPAQVDNMAGLDTKMIMPAKGWKVFEQYIADNKKLITRLKPVAVRVSFTVAADGSVQEVSCQKTSCSACEVDAKKLVANSGSWKNTAGKPQHMEYIIKY